MVLLLYKFTIFSFFPIILENIWQRTAAAEIDQNNSDGELFIEKVVNGEKTVFERPEYLLFTAPYKICEGGCSNNKDNFVMEFPLFIGKKGLAKYTDYYRRDHQKIYSGRPNAPLKKRPTKKLFTLCPSEKYTTSTTTTTEKSEAPTTQDAETVTEKSSTRTNGSSSDEKEDQITESDQDTEPEIESTQTEVILTSNAEMEPITQINESSSKHDTETSHTNLKLGIETIQVKPTEIKTGPQTESPTNTELTIEMSQNDTQLDRNDNRRITIDPSQAEKKQTNIESTTPVENINKIKENTKTTEDSEVTGELELRDESVSAKESTQMKESIVMSEEIVHHENGSINSDENTQIEENMELTGETQYGTESINSKEITKTDKIYEITRDPQNGDDASKENIETTENTAVSRLIEHTDDSINALNNAILNDQDKKNQYNPTYHSRLYNSHTKLKLKIRSTSYSDGDAYTKILLFRPTYTAITNAMGEMCPFYVCSKMVKVKSDTDLNKLELTTDTRDESNRNFIDTDVTFNQKYSYKRREWPYEIKENSKFEHHRDVTSANTKVHFNLRENQINESEEFPPYSDDDDGTKNSNQLRVQSNDEDEFESYSDYTEEIYMLLILLAIGSRGSGNLPWSRWHWTFPHEPNTGLFRRFNDGPVKTIANPCRCPPSKECKVDFKPNEAAVDFLKLRGVLNEDQVMDIKEDFDIQNWTTVRLPARRSANDGDECCCPPRTLMMPTFITSKEFDKTVEGFQDNKD